MHIFFLTLFLFSVFLPPSLLKPKAGEIEESYRLELPRPSLPNVGDLFSFFSTKRTKQLQDVYQNLEYAENCSTQQQEEQEACFRKVFSYKTPTNKMLKEENLSEVFNNDVIQLLQRPHQIESQTENRFSKYIATELGVTKQANFTPLDIVSPFSHGRGLTSGDYDKDGFPDLALALEDGIALYKNTKEFSFEHQALTLEKAYSNIFLVAFVDLNNDAWLDLFFTSYGGHVGYFLNNEGSFSSITWLPQTNRLLSLAAAFTDIDQDGDLDIILGNWSGVLSDNQIHRYSENELFLNNNGAFTQARFETHLGETLSVLASDLDAQYGPDILIANDFASPDTFLLSKENGFSLIENNDNYLNRTPYYSMSWDSADIDNDLDLDLFGTDMSFTQEDAPYYCDQLIAIEEKIACQENFEMRTIIQRKNAEACLSFVTQRQQEDCLYAIRREIAREKQDKRICEELQHNPAHYRNCLEASSENKRLSTPLYQETALKQVTQNTLLLQNGQEFTDATDLFEVASSNWAWNASFADLDNDGWQDLYIGNGFHFQGVYSNVLFKNESGKSFSRAEQEFGLQDFINTPSFSYADIDHDGDIDLISSGVNGPYRIFENHFSGNRVTFSFQDSKGNYSGIGSKVIIRYDDKQQIRELKMSGGYLSFHEPMLHFGLADIEYIDSVEIIWSTGETQILNTPIEANHHYIIKR